MTAFTLLISALVAATSQEISLQSSDSATVVSIVASFHKALRTGDSATALAFLDRDALILESGGSESRAEYRSHHLPGDIKFARSVQSKESLLRVAVNGSNAWVASTSVVDGTFEGKQIRSAGAELIVLRRTRTGWKIAAIHWSSRSRRPAP